MEEDKMKLLKKSLIVIIALIMATMIFAGCKDNTSNEEQKNEATEQIEDSKETAETSKETQEAKEPVTLRVYSWDNEYAIQAVAEAFNQQNPDIQVELVLPGWEDYQDTLFTSLAGGESIDAYFIRLNEVFSTYVSKGLAYPLDNLLAAKDIDVSIYGGYVDQLQVDGTTYALPYRGSGFYLFYNKDLFDAAGVDYPDGTYTWEKYREVALQLTSGSGQDKVYGSFFEPSMYILPVLSAMQAGVDIVTDDYNTEINDEKIKEALEYYKTLTHEDGSQPTLAEIKATSIATSSSFIPQKVAMIMAGDWFPGRLNSAKESGDLTFEWGITRIPCDEDDYITAGVATKGCVAGGSENPEAAFEFLSFVCTDEGQKIIASEGSKPALLNEEAVDIFSESMGFDQETKDVFFESVSVVNEPLNMGAAYAKQIMNEEFTLYFTDAQDIDTTMTNLYERLDEALSELR
jgi:multiple sugar transport system substrate-binding protein